MTAGNRIILCGASTRALAYSALRAGLEPHCLDLFADRDLQRIAPIRRVASESYPESLERLTLEMPPGPWMYTGALENHPKLIDRIAESHPLWGNNSDALERARSPYFVQETLRGANLPYLEARRPTERLSPNKEWLFKPLRGAGGTGIRMADAHCSIPFAYAQERIEGESCSAIYLGYSEGAHLLGATKQLIGVSWLYAAPFRYCGSVGPLSLSSSTEQRLCKMGEVLGKACELRGLFGIDFLLRDEIPWLVEINPRYSASVEILEHATGLAFLEWHQCVFERDSIPRIRIPSSTKVIGKAIRYASSRIPRFGEGPWEDALLTEPPIHKIPTFADIPEAGEEVPCGAPIFTFFAQGETLAECEAQLRATAQQLDSLLVSH